MFLFADLHHATELSAGKSACMFSWCGMHRVTSQVPTIALPSEGLIWPFKKAWIGLSRAVYQRLELGCNTRTFWRCNQYSPFQALLICTNDSASTASDSRFHAITYPFKLCQYQELYHREYKRRNPLSLYASLPVALVQISHSQYP